MIACDWAYVVLGVATGEYLGTKKGAEPEDSTPFFWVQKYLAPSVYMHFDSNYKSVILGVGYSFTSAANRGRSSRCQTTPQAAHLASSVVPVSRSRVMLSADDWISTPSFTRDT